MEMITLKCTNCGKEIQIPSDLEVFSCLYCGTKHRMSALMPPTLPADEADRDYVEVHLLDCVRHFPDAYLQFNRKQYEAAFAAHREAIQPTFEAMDRWVCAQPARREELLEGFVQDFLAQWEEFQANHPKAKSKSAKNRQAFADKMTLACFTVPALLSLDLSVGEDFARLLRDRFNTRYPDNIFELGTYEEMREGFRKHGFCFVTTAVCQAEGKPDDCAELTAFRAFRDGWLARTEQGRALIEEYYDLAPALVAAMRYGDREADCCAALRRDYLDPCYEALGRQDPERCLRSYQSMIRSLQSRYLIN